MKKEALLLPNIVKDLKTVARSQMSSLDNWRLSYIIPCTLLAILLGILLKSIWIGLLIFSVAAYHIVQYSLVSKAYMKKKKAIRNVLDRGDISITVETLSHIAIQTVYEPHNHGGKKHLTKEVTFFYFESGSSWRVPDTSAHYEWSKDYYVSTNGLENISVQGNDFFYVTLQGYYDISYIYPCKFFDLDDTLKDSKKT